MALRTKLYTMQEVGALLLSAGFIGENAVTALAVLWAESGGNAWAVNVNSAPGKPTDGSLDLGIAQFNTYWWPWQRANDLMKIEHSIPLFYRASKNGTYFGYWNAYVNKYHLKFMDYARAALFPAV